MPRGAAPIPEEEVKSYTIHISSKYLNLTRQKLELTRLPRDVPHLTESERWEPKSTVEPLVDYWLEQFSWRDQEAEFNASIPQFRTAIRTTSSDGPDGPVRLHFIHSRSPHASAVPLLLIPVFPFTNLSFTHLMKLFTTPDDPTKDIPFHLVIPSLPGLGFSDAITSNRRMIPRIAQMFDRLMQRLGYAHYLATNTAPSPNSISDIDWSIINHLAASYPDSCLGVHMVSPPFNAPTWQSAPLEWIKWKAAATFSTPMLGYSQDDITAFRQQAKPKQKPLIPGLGMNKEFEPTTLAYALCDSPTGLLLFILMVLRILGPEHEFSSRDIIRIAELTWLPGPEGTMRLWTHCTSRQDDPKTGSKKPKIGITAFSHDQRRGSGPEYIGTFLAPNQDSHTCLAWGKSRYNIVSWQRVSGSPGLLAWERPEVIAAGVRGLANAIVPGDDRLQPSGAQITALLEQVVVDEDHVAPPEISGTTIQAQEMSLPATTAHAKAPGEQSNLKESPNMQRRPPTPLSPVLGSSSQDFMQDSEDISQGSSGGSPSTIKPIKRSLQ